MKNAQAMSDRRLCPTLRTNIEYAFAAGFSTAFPLYLLMKQEAEEFSHSFPQPQDIFMLSLLPGLYLLTAVLLWLCRKTAIGRSIPHWLGISLIGSQLFVPSMFLYATIAIHGDIDFITFERMMWGGVIGLVLSVCSSTATAAVRYLPSLITAIKTRLHRR